MKEIKLYSSIKPELKSGEYTISIKEQQIYGNNTVAGKKELNDALKTVKHRKTFKVIGEKFSINGSHIASVYPGKNAIGDFKDELPYITFYREHLPWMRNGHRDNSWMALLLLPVFNEPAKQGWKLETKSIAAYLKTLNPNVEGNVLGEENTEGSCRILIIDDANLLMKQTGQLLWNDTKPLTTKQALQNASLFCHVREVDVQNTQISTHYKNNQIEEGKKKKSIVVSHKSPPKEGKFEAHLVSLEHINLSEIKQGDALELVSLYSWAFEHHSEGNDSFEKLGSKLFEGDKKSNLFFQDKIVKDCISDLGNIQKKEISSVLSSCFTEINPAIHDLYPNDFYPQKLEEKLSSNPEKVSSYLMAWELGKMLALSDRRFLTAKQLLKNTHHQNLLNKLHLSNSNHVSIRKKINTNINNPNEVFKIDADRHVLMQAPVQKIVDKKLVSKNIKNVLKYDSVDKKSLQDIKNLVDKKKNPALRKSLSEKTNSYSQEFHSISNFITDVHMLRNIPFSYLVLDKKMLPEDSLKFFYVNPNWIDCVIKGAFSVGYHPVIHEDFMDTTYNELKAHGKYNALLYRNNKLKTQYEYTNSEQLCGFILRSKIVTYYPHVQIKAYNVSKNSIDHSNPSQLVNPVHIEQKGEDVLLVLYNETPKSIQISEPDHGLRFKANSNTLSNKNSAELAKTLTGKRQYIGL